MSKKVGVTFRDRKKVEPYFEALRQVGLEPVGITPHEPGTLEGLGGLLVTGGKDVDPARYGQAKHPETDADGERDKLEADLLRKALDADLPVLAICRGAQLFNVVHGGNLIQHLASSGVHKAPPEELDVHAVRVAENTRLAAIVGQASLRVNSRHHQAADDVGPGLVVSARSDDGVIEALERPDKSFALAVQWHPEDRCRIDANDRKLFEAFAEAVESIP